MNSEELRKGLKDPLVLNFVMAVFAVERIYDLSLAKFTATGHFVVLVMFVSGFVCAFWSDRYADLRTAAYVILASGLLFGLYCVMSDITTVERLVSATTSPNACLQEIGSMGFWEAVSANLADFVKLLRGKAIC